MVVDRNDLVVDSYDVEDLSNTEEGCTNLLSLLSQNILNARFHSGFTTWKRKNIITWQQVIVYERADNVLPAVVYQYANKRQIREERLVLDGCGIKSYYLPDRNII